MRPGSVMCGAGSIAAGSTATTSAGAGSGGATVGLQPMIAAYIARSFWAISMSFNKPAADDALDIATTPITKQPFSSVHPRRQFSHHMRKMSTTLLSLIINHWILPIIRRRCHIGELVLMLLVARAVFVEALEPRVCLAAPTQWISRGPGGGGAFFAPSFSPFNSADMYVVTDMSGVFHSTNSGASWQLQGFKQLQGNRQSRVQFTSDPNVLYILDDSSLADGSEPVRPKKSIDGGATWNPVAGWS